MSSGGLLGLGRVAFSDFAPPYEAEVPIDLSAHSYFLPDVGAHRVHELDANAVARDGQHLTSQGCRPNVYHQNLFYLQLLYLLPGLVSAFALHAKEPSKEIVGGLNFQDHFGHFSRVAYDLPYKAVSAGKEGVDFESNADQTARNRIHEMVLVRLHLGDFG